MELRVHLIILVLANLLLVGEGFILPPQTPAPLKKKALDRNNFMLPIQPKNPSAILIPAPSVRAHPTIDPLAPFLSLITFVVSSPSSALAAYSPLSTGAFNPDSFKPICQASDGFYRFLQAGTQALVGPENFVDYGPLIAGGLLRIRLELCVVESFFNEAVVPFVRENGLSWVLPFHETIETFVAGTIFALASTFILVGSTKLVTVIVTFADVFAGSFLRCFGGFGFDRAAGKPMTFVIGIGPWKKRLIGSEESKEEAKNELKLGVTAVTAPLLLVFGSAKYAWELSKFVREVAEGIDLFVGRYLVLISAAYVGVKFLHFKVFPDFPF